MKPIEISLFCSYLCTRNYSSHTVENYGRDLVGSKNSCGFARVVFQESPKPFATLHRALALCILAGRRKEQDIALALRIPLMMEMLDILRQRMAE